MINDDILKQTRREYETKPPDWTQDPATDRQIGFITGLVRSREIPVSWLERIKELTDAGLKKGDAGKIISELKKLPLKPGQDDRSLNKPTIADIPPGRYAVPVGDKNDISFYRVKENKEKTGKYLLVIAGPNEHFISGPPMQEAVKRIVRFGIGDAAVLYGQKVGRCSQCHIRITNRISRELGIGPVCGGRVYDDWETRVKRAKRSLIERGLDPNENVYG